MTQHDRLLTMVSELDDQGYTPEQIARAVKIPLDRVSDLLDEIDCIPVQVITAPKENTVLNVEIEWAEPPAPVQRGRGKAEQNDAIVAALKARPGQWAVVQRGNATSGVTTWTKRGCEAVARRGANSPDGGARYDVYARWPA